MVCIPVNLCMRQSLPRASAQKWSRSLSRNDASRSQGVLHSGPCPTIIFQRPSLGIWYEFEAKGGNTIARDIHSSCSRRSFRPLKHQSTLQTPTNPSLINNLQQLVSVPTRAFCSFLLSDVIMPLPGLRYMTFLSIPTRDCIPSVKIAVLVCSCPPPALTLSADNRHRRTDPTEPAMMVAIHQNRTSLFSKLIDMSELLQHMPKGLRIKRHG